MVEMFFSGDDVYLANDFGKEVLWIARPDLFGAIQIPNSGVEGYDQYWRRILESRPRLPRKLGRKTGIKPARKIETIPTIKQLRAAEARYGDAVRHLRATRKRVDVPIVGTIGETVDSQHIACQQRTGETAEQLRTRLANAAAEFLATFADGGKRWLALQSGLGSIPLVGKLGRGCDEHGDYIGGSGHVADRAAWRERKRGARKLSSRERKAIRAIRELLGAQMCDLLSTDLDRATIAQRLNVAPGTISRAKAKARSTIEV